MNVRLVARDRRARRDVEDEVPPRCDPSRSSRMSRGFSTPARCCHRAPSDPVGAPRSVPLSLDAR
jgi:hypothetical protein